MNMKIKNIKKYFSVKDLSDFKNYIINVVIINFIFNWISLNDVLMANRYLDKLSAGYYSTIALIIKMFFYIGAPMAAVMFSYILISMKNKNKDIFFGVFIFVGFFNNICKTDNINSIYRKIRSDYYVNSKSGAIRVFFRFCSFDF